MICFGNYLFGTQSTHGGFLPIFWDAPSSYLHAATDIGSAVEWIQSCFTLSPDENGRLAVLHNRNKMVSTFGNFERITQSEGRVLSRSVTSCAGMTAHLVLLAQTKVGFLSGGRSRPFHDLPPEEQHAQREEAACSEVMFDHGAARHEGPGRGGDSDWMFEIWSWFLRDKDRSSGPCGCT